MGVTDENQEREKRRRRDLAKLSLGALGVVYGDIGTSPLYAVRECFSAHYGETPTPENVLSVLSLVFWALVVVVVVKYLVFVLRADNRGEGGILALMALVTPNAAAGTQNWRKRGVILLGVFGTALLFADGALTPAISVLSAMEGLKLAMPAMQAVVIPMTLVILLALFVVQRHGTASIASWFGPAMLVWFATLALLGIPWVLREPGVLQAVSPHHAVRLFLVHPYESFKLLGAIVLCITGAEALYADMGHFGSEPIRRAWFTVVYPGLLLNYFGQGALILVHGPQAAANPFFLLAPSWLLLPLVTLATIATIIASQALITGAYSLAQQAVQLGFLPRLTIVHTSSHMSGQIYIPEVNWLLMVACVGLVLGFGSSANLAAAYGIAVVGTMFITTLLLAVVARRRWKWKPRHLAALISVLLIVDGAFLASNLTKINTGGWWPLVMGAGLFAVMTTWSRGTMLLGEQMRARTMPVHLLVSDVAAQNPHRVKGTAVFMTADPDQTPGVLLHHFKHNQVFHERVILLSVLTPSLPHVTAAERLRVTDLGQGFHQVVAQYGFMEDPNIREVLRLCEVEGLSVDPMQCSYYLGRTTMLTTGRGRMMRWRKRLFSFLARNARDATLAFGVPANRVVELGRQIEL